MRSICFWMLKHVWIDVCPSCKGNEYWYWCPTHTVAGKEWAGEHKKQGVGGCYECAIGQQELSHSQAPISVSYRSPSCLVLGSTPDGPFAVSHHVVWDLWARCLKRVCEIQMSAFSSRSQSRSGVSSSFLPIYALEHLRSRWFRPHITIHNITCFLPWMPGRYVITMVRFDTESTDCMRAHKVGTFNPARLPCTRSIGASGPFRKTKASPQRFRLDFGWAVHSSHIASIVGVP